MACEWPAARCSSSTTASTPDRSSPSDPSIRLTPLFQRGSCWLTPLRVFLNANWDFKAPVRPGDEITGAVEILEARDDKPITKLRTTVTRGDGTVVLDGTAVCFTARLSG